MIDLTSKIGKSFEMSLNPKNLEKENYLRLPLISLYSFDWYIEALVAIKFKMLVAELRWTVYSCVANVLSHNKLNIRIKHIFILSSNDFLLHKAELL